MSADYQFAYAIFLCLLSGWALISNWRNFGWGAYVADTLAVRVFINAAAWAYRVATP